MDSISPKNSSAPTRSCSDVNLECTVYMKEILQLIPPAHPNVDCCNSCMFLLTWPSNRAFVSTWNKQSKEILESMEEKSRKTSLSGEEGKAKSVGIYS